MNYTTLYTNRSYKLKERKIICYLYKHKIPKNTLPGYTFLAKKGQFPIVWQVLYLCEDLDNIKLTGKNSKEYPTRKYYDNLNELLLDLTERLKWQPQP